MDCRNKPNLIESVTSCHEAKLVGPYWVANPVYLAVLAAKSEYYTTAP